MDKQISIEDRILYLVSFIPFFGIRIVEWYEVRKMVKEMIPIIFVEVINQATYQIIDDISPSSASSKERE